MRLVYITLAWCAGIVYAASLRAPIPLAWMIGAGSAVILALVVQKTRFGLIVAACFAFGGLRYVIHPTTSALAAYNNRGGATITGIVTRPPTLSGDHMMLTVTATQIDDGRGMNHATTGNALVQAPLTTTARSGDRVRVTGDMIAPSRYGAFSYADYLARADVYTLMRETSVEVIDSNAQPTILTSLSAIRAQAAVYIASAIPEPEAGLLTGILLGDDSRIAPLLEDDFAATGAAHIVAISGFNMIVVSGIVTATLARLRVPRRRAALLSLAVVALYTIFVGASAAVVRAALMSGLLIIGGALRRRTFVPASLAFSAVILSLVNPLTLWDVGFQLSFAAVMGIALFATPFTRAFDRFVHRLLPKDTAERVIDFLTEPLIVSLAATLATLPLTALYFGRVSVITIGVNLLIVPFQPLVLILGGLASALAFIIPSLAALCFALVFVLLALTIDIVRAFAALPFAQIGVDVHRHIILMFFTGIGAVMMIQAARPNWAVNAWHWLKRQRLIGVILLIIAAALIIGVAYWDGQPDGELHIWLLDVGHSNAVLIQTPGGLHFLFDGGRYPANLLTQLGDRLPFYKRSLDLLAITHPDPNEYLALGDVIDRYQVGSALINGQPNTNPAYTALINRIGMNNVITPLSGYAFTTADGVTIQVLNPLTTPATRAQFGVSTLVIRLIYRDVRVLFPSDLSADGQIALLDAGVDVSANVLVMPQHGRENALDDSFLAAVNPDIGLLQLDPANRDGDPAPDVLALLGDLRLYRTDEGGTIHVRSDGRILAVSYEDF